VTARPALRVIEGRSGRPQMDAALEFLGLGIGLTLVLTWLGRLPSWFHDLGRFQILFALAFAFYGLALWRLDRYARLPRVGWVVFGVALAARMALVATPPSLSLDLYRYVWEGKVLLHGMNPYHLGPADPALSSLRDGVIWPQVNHPELAAIYPPLALLSYAALAAVSSTVIAFKLWGVLCDLAVVAVLLRWAQRRGASPARVIAYAWNPLVLIEYSGSGHNDPLAMLGLAVALMLADSRPGRSALAFAGGALVKLGPLVALPFLWRRWPWGARAVALVALAVGLASYWALTRGPESGLTAYLGSWRNNEFGFHMLERGLGSFAAARAAALAAVLMALAWAWLRRWPLERATRLGIRLALLVGPVVHPWYLGWELMFQPLAISAPWIVFSLTVVLNYGMLRTPLEGRSFHLPYAARGLEYGIPLAVFGLSLVLRRVRAWRAARALRH